MRLYAYALAYTCTSELIYVFDTCIDSRAVNSLLSRCLPFVCISTCTYHLRMRLGGVVSACLGLDMSYINTHAYIYHTYVRVQVQYKYFRAELLSWIGHKTHLPLLFLLLGTQTGKRITFGISHMSSKLRQTDFNPLSTVKYSECEQTQAKYDRNLLLAKYTSPDISCSGICSTLTPIYCLSYTCICI